MKGVSKVRDRAVTANALTADPYGTYSEESGNKLRSQEPSPFELRVGTSYEPTSDLTLAFDGSLYTGTGDRKIRSSPSVRARSTPRRGAAHGRAIWSSRPGTAR